MKRIITLLLACVMLLTSVMAISCANNEPSDSNNQDDGNDRIYLDQLPDDLDFQGQEICFVFAEGTNGFTQRSIEVEEESADSVDKVVYQRNVTVETRLNVDVVSFQASTSITGLAGAITSSLSAASGEYDVIAGYQYYDIGLATEGYLINYNDLGSGEYEGMNYINLDAPYWASAYNNSISYNGSTYWITGDLALRYLGGMYCTYVNETIYNDKLLDTYGSIYEIAKKGDWTLDLLNEMAILCYEDLGADGTDEEDMLGYAWEANDPIDGLAFASNVKFSTAYSDGSMAITLKNDHTVMFLEKLEKVLTSSYSCEIADGDSANVMTAFASGNVAFTVNKIFQAETYLREMEDNYYIIPAPKLNKDQANYVTGIHDGCTIFAIPYDAPNVAASAATLEALAAESLRTVTPEYYDSSLKFKYTRDDIASEMIDLIRSCTDTNFAAAWSASCNGIVHFFRTNYTTKTTSSSLKKTGDTATTHLKTLLEELDALKVTE